MAKNKVSHQRLVNEKDFYLQLFKPSTEIPSVEAFSVCIPMFKEK